MTLNRATGDSVRRIAMVAACPFPSARGSQVLIRELAQALANRGHHVHLVTYPFAESLTPIHGLFVHRVRFSRRVPSRGGLGWRKLLFDVALVMTLYKVVRRERIEVIHAHNYEGPLVGYLVRRLTGVPVVYHSHNALSDELGHYFRPGWRRLVASKLGAVLDRQVPRRADFSIALTPELEQFLRARGVAGDRVAVIPPGSSPAVIAETPASDPFAGRFVVMYTGNLDGYQDLSILFDAFGRFHKSAAPALLVVVTHEVQWAKRADDRLARLLREGHARVIVASAFSVVRRLMARADVLVCPRSSWSGFPIKLINYMAAGRSLVAAEGSAKGIVSGETGLIFRNGDPEDLASALRRLFEDAALRQRLGENARVAAGRLYSWKRAVAEIERIYAAVAGVESPRPQARTLGSRRFAGIDSFRQSSYKRRGQRLT